MLQSFKQDLERERERECSCHSILAELYVSVAPVAQLNPSDTLSLRSECMGGYEPSFSHPLYGPAERRHTEGAAGVQEAVACRCLITAETARSVAGQYPAGSGVLPASSTTHTHAHSQKKSLVSVSVWFIFLAVISVCNANNHIKIDVFCKHLLLGLLSLCRKIFG